jgi:hypothetical protein
MKLLKLNMIMTIMFLFTILSGCEVQEQKTEDLGRFNKLSWMDNIWRGKQSDAKIYESWHKKNFRLMEGISYTTDKNGQRVYSQNMRIEQNNNQIYYIIRLPGDQQQTLKLTDVTDSSAVFKNQGDGYPEKITYRHPADDSLIVLLNGENDGTSMNTKLRYEKD